MMYLDSIRIAVKILLIFYLYLVATRRWPLGPMWIYYWGIIFSSFTALLDSNPTIRLLSAVDVGLCVYIIYKNRKTSNRLSRLISSVVDKGHKLEVVPNN